MAYSVKITRNATDDIYTFYGNTLLWYPNIWTVDNAIRQANKVLDEMVSTIINGLNGKRTPLLVNLQTNQTVELYTKDKRWYYTVRIEEENAIIENAVYTGNESNRAYRRGTSSPNSPLELDDRRQQGRINTSTKSTFTLPQKMITLNGSFINGLKIGYYNRRYIILKQDETPFVQLWYDDKPRFFKRPYGNKGIIAYVNVHGWLKALDANGKLYDMQRTWKSVFLGKNEWHRLIGSIITETINQYLKRELIA